MKSLNSNKSKCASTVDETLSKNEDDEKEGMKDGENEKTEKNPAKFTNEVGEKMCALFDEMQLYLLIILKLLFNQKF